MAAPAKAARKGSKGQRPCGTPGCTLLENHVGNCTSQQVGGRRSHASSILLGGYSVELPASQAPSTKQSPMRPPAAVSTTAPNNKGILVTGLPPEGTMPEWSQKDKLSPEKGMGGSGKGPVKGGGKGTAKAGGSGKGTLRASSYQGDTKEEDDEAWSMDVSDPQRPSPRTRTKQLVTLAATTKQNADGIVTGGRRLCAVPLGQRERLQVRLSREQQRRRRRL